jgi:hypothetical protein
MRQAALIFIVLVSQVQIGKSATPAFHPLGKLPGNGYTLPIGLSDDGRVVIGQTHGPSFRWTEADGIHEFVVPEFPFASITDISSDGESVFGSGTNLSVGSALFRMDGLGNVTFPIMPPAINSPFNSVLASANEQAFAFVHIVTPSTSERELARWTVDGGMEFLGDFEGGDVLSRPHDISSDGSTIVGVGTDEAGGRAFRWTAVEGMVPIIEGDHREFATIARGVSANGDVVVGFGPLLADANAPWRWSKTGGLELLSRRDEAPTDGWALDVSADGSRVVGNDFARGPFLWSEPTGMLHIQDLLTTRYGLSDDLEGWQLFTADVISADGKVVAGTAFDPSGELTGWVATVPEPSSLILLAFGAGLLAVNRRRKRTLRHR